MAEPGLLTLSAIALLVSVVIRLLVDATEVATAAVAAVNLIGSMTKEPPEASAAVLAAALALSNMEVKLKLSPKATVKPAILAVLMASTMLETMKLERVDMDGATEPGPVLAPCSAAAPMAIMLATIRALLLISRACSRLMPLAASSVDAVAVLMVSMRVRSAPTGKPRAELTAAKASALTSEIRASF